MKDVLLKLIDIMQLIAIEQATREFSGSNWGKQTVDNLQKIKDTVLNFPENDRCVYEVAFKNEKIIL